MGGITFGHIIQLIIVCLGFGKVFQLYPNIQIWLKILCSAYMVYLCYRVIGSLSSFKQNDAKPIKFYEAALFQIVNPKTALELQQKSRNRLNLNKKTLSRILSGKDE